MAKRRNLKKEKALRNQAYARKFRKRSNNRYGRRMNNSKPESEENNNNSTEKNDKDTSKASSD
ncbi:MAG: hypothetical protein AAGB01_11175 [Cyanobacteria bacterium P01_F01_bin.42]